MDNKLWALMSEICIEIELDEKTLDKLGDEFIRRGFKANERSWLVNQLSEHLKSQRNRIDTILEELEELR
ncbi:hypothetical protein [Halalkalibacter okhensis]|uniref:Uncharacterized protein n=1 Tax=Halalkalibacter okhensis TaxID=333138 RepID=A0A0B0IHE8_9BACI|nr:hypothetical protein [Halalkalibacter okhensis]KHF40725.1 hypothetical protein LQ50_08030 [Halalkalibacter okhensis]